MSFADLLYIVTAGFFTGVFLSALGWYVAGGRRDANIEGVMFGAAIGFIIISGKAGAALDAMDPVALDYATRYFFGGMLAGLGLFLFYAIGMEVNRAHRG